MHDQIDWDTEVDTPASLAIIGGGPCGVEAGLYARFLGYSVELYEQNKVGDSILAWEDRPMPTTWRELASSLGLAAIQAHDHPLPDLDQTPSCREYVEQYLLPIARCDLLHDSVNIKTKVTSVSRLGCDERDSIPIDVRAEQEFRLLISSEQRAEAAQIFDVVLDCSGGQWLRQGAASGGGHSIGWKSAEPRISFGRRRVLTKERSVFSGKRILLYGRDSSAATNALEIASLADKQTQLFWVVPKSLSKRESLLDLSQSNEIPTQDEMAKAEQLYRQADSDSIVAMSAWGIEAISERDGRLIVCLQITEDETVEVAVDHIIYCGDCLPGPTYHHQLRMHNVSHDAVVQAEPHFYLLGNRAALAADPSRGYHSLTFGQFRDQIRRVFGMVGGRAELDLYQTVKPLDQPVD